MGTDDERRRVAAALREYASFDCEDEGEEECLVDCADWGERVLNLLGCGDTEGECYAALADLIDPDSHPNSGTEEVQTSQVPKFDPTERGIDSIYEWCFEHIEGADGAEDELFCSIMRAIEDYRHPELATAYTVRAVDREALLALADDMDRDGKIQRGRQKVGERWFIDGLDVREYARRIREACGEES